VLLELKNIEKIYPSPSGENNITVLNNLSFQIAAGNSVAIVGPSGSGKSTLLNIIGALDKPTSGTVILEDKNLALLKEEDLDKIRNRKIGFVFQLHHLLPQCTVLENVLIPTLAAKSKGIQNEAQNRAKQLLERVGLAEHFHHRPSQLSGGELQRVAVVRALINRPQLLLADEPTGSLDQDTSENLGHLLVELNREEGVTLIVVTHSYEIAHYMQTIYQLRNGKLEKNESN
jgi:lipoprotein-releasing system ATP-binding protein